MSKFVLLLAICCLCLLQAKATRNNCQNLTRQCLANVRETGTVDDVTNTFNDNCRRANRSWKNISRCQLIRAACELTVNRCSVLSCANVLKVPRG